MPLYLVGAGTGDPALLTVRAAALLSRARLVLHDAGADDRLLALAPAGAERRALRPGPSGPQVVEAASAAAEAVRLVDGDGWSAGAADAAALRRAGLAFEIVPGVSPGEPKPRPLLGRTVVVTRARAQADELVATLRDLGAEVVLFPTIRIVPAADPSPMRRAAQSLGGYDWAIFTSVNGVENFWETLTAEGLDSRAFAGVHVAAIGPATAASLAARGIRAELVPDRYVAEALVEELAAAAPLEGANVLLARAAVARDVLPESLVALGASVDEVEAYRTLPETEGAAALRARLDEGSIDILTFTASSTVRHFVDAVGAGIGGARVAAIGPITAATARELGLEVAVEAREHTVPGMVQALLESERAP